jgi:phosphoribosylformylglycinamidine cyclo-ligase
MNLTFYQVVKGIVDGCKESDCILLGGETAEMPGFYPEGEYDLAGFAVGSVKKEKVIDGSRIKAGDVVLGVASSGVHSNGFSLVRKVLEVSGKTMHDIAPWSGESFGLTLLTPTVLYVKTALKLIDAVDVRVSIFIYGF